MSNISKDNKLSDQEREILEYTRMSIFERRKTQYILLIFFLTVVGVCASLVLNNFKPPEPNDNLIFVLLFPIILIIPLHTLFWYQLLQIERLDAERRLIIPGINPWQSKMGVISLNLTLLLPLIALPALSGFLLHNDKKGLFEITQFKFVFWVSIIVCLVAIWVEVYGHLQTKRIRSVYRNLNKNSSN